MAVQSTTLQGLSIPLPPPENGWFDISQAVTQTGALAMLQADCNVAALLRARKPLPAGARARLFSFDGKARGRTAEFALEDWFLLVDQFPGGSWIVAGARCPVGHDNARHLAADGTLISRFCLGDGIQHLQCDTDGGIWCGYFDEGVYGNLGWGNAGGPEPIGAPGLRRFDGRGRPSWSYSWESTGSVIDDCYALNVSGNQAWAYYYSDFPIMRIDETRQCRQWQTQIRGSGAVAVDGSLAMLVGGYGKATDLVLLRLETDEPQVLVEAMSGIAFDRENAPSLFQARHDTMHVVQAGQWRRFSVAQVAEATGILP